MGERNPSLLLLKKLHLALVFFCGGFGFERT